MIQLNKNPAGRINNIGFGICAIVDGLIRVISLGFLHTTLTLNYSRMTARFFIKRMAKDLVNTNVQ